jgi:ATP-dependent RNA helicase SUPV3L1/SUV3
MPISFSSPVTRDGRLRGAGVTAVLGPTNTGKTHLAIERMLGHSSGMIGLPLRLLAREVYNKVADRVGAENVALITGEEKIKPPNPRYWVATVEAMPRDLDLPSSPSTRCSSAPTSIAATSSPTACSTAAAARRRWCSAPPPSGPMVEKLLRGANIVQRPRLSTLIPPATERSPGCRDEARSSRSRPTRSTPSPN